MGSVRARARARVPARVRAPVQVVRAPAPVPTRQRPPLAPWAEEEGPRTFPVSTARLRSAVTNPEVQPSTLRQRSDCSGKEGSERRAPIRVPRAIAQA